VTNSHSYRRAGRIVRYRRYREAAGICLTPAGQPERSLVLAGALDRSGFLSGDTG
jgi:hypothetical protein